MVFAKLLAHHKIALLIVRARPVLVNRVHVNAVAMAHVLTALVAARRDKHV